MLPIILKIVFVSTNYETAVSFYHMQKIKWFYNVLPCWNIFKIKFSINFMDRQIFLHFRYSLLCHQSTLACFSGAPKYM